MKKLLLFGCVILALFLIGCKTKEDLLKEDLTRLNDSVNKVGQTLDSINEAALADLKSRTQDMELQPKNFDISDESEKLYISIKNNNNEKITYKITSKCIKPGNIPAKSFLPDKELVIEAGQVEVISVELMRNDAEKGIYSCDIEATTELGQNVKKTIGITVE